MYKSFLRKVLNLFDVCLPKKSRVCFFITARTSWDPNQQILYTKYKDKFEVIVVDGNHVSSSKPLRSLKCFYNIYRSKVVIFDHSLPMGLIKGNHYCINVWHGSPIKNIRCLLKERFSKDFLDYQSNVTDLILSNSDFDSVQMQKCFNVSDDKLLASGLPRNIYTTCNETELKKIDLYDDDTQIRDIIQGFEKTLLWAPTYRGDSHQFNDPLNLTREEISYLHQYLISQNILLLVRYHKFSSCSNDSFFKHPHIVDVSSIKNQNILLRYTDSLITDYSSIWVDYLLKRKPIVFYCPDLDDYKENHGFINDFEISIPSKVHKSFIETLSYLSSYTELNDSKQYNKLYNRYHFDNDANLAVAEIEHRIMTNY
ncbi:CDP-glycerol glycerophosphotransferase family protein [Shewanella electrodiphila]|uniref:CDP-glycerol glycerophosphotransferase family protein n=1 Tax=Shewanella electrodiphila TaxID=934143 RepID=A0ABT0KJX0_9GAMM|nr:CDP-glycerol glycerophosphotransferase family protein [Shewanella electrodiphila]MCL1044132.1 CDP-glycerol glycerophosphotransferase family protein [Shewanella electrodiphila]